MRRRCGAIAGLILALGAHSAPGTVFINEVFMNPPGSLDDTREFIELSGTPGKKLDGYAIAFLNGTEQKFYPLNSIPPFPAPSSEIDEFFSLDGLALGGNGLLVLALGSRGNYPEALPDTAFQANWSTLWNGGLDVPGRLQNDGSNTVILIRRRPGRTQADPLHPDGLHWGKAILHDVEVLRPVEDPQDGALKDQWGDGNLDAGTANGLGGFNRDMVGAVTPLDPSDDLEVVDEVSYEHERGWEYDTDERTVDRDSPLAGRPERRVHALDDPQGFNPDVLARVDSRRSGPGWVPAPGAIGDMSNGNNWADTATEQWIRGESTVVIGPMGPELYFSNGPNANPDAIQPFTTNVPMWLDDGIGHDYDFSSETTYRITPGRVNPLSHAGIPGDVDRDGDCDSGDIDRLLSVLGDDDWVFSNGFDEALETSRGDPAEQTRPWDVDQTGADGIECSDLQWVLNFQENSDGRVKNRTYDSTIPSSEGVPLNDHTGVACNVSWTAVSLEGRPFNALAVSDTVDIDIHVAVTSGANSAEDELNGVMQLVQDLEISAADVIRVVDVQALGAFTLGRPAIISLRGEDGDLGAATIHAYTTSFAEGLSQTSSAYRVRLKAVGLGSGTVSLHPADAANFAASTPFGLKVGHTDSNGNPASVSYPTSLSVEVNQTISVAGDCNADGLADIADVTCFVGCMEGPSLDALPDCRGADVDDDGAVDLRDWSMLEGVLRGQ